MSRKKTAKPFWDMSTEELREATRKFDEEFVADKARPLTPEMQRRWERAKAKTPPAENGVDEETIAVRLEKALLKTASDRLSQRPGSGP